MTFGLTNAPATFQHFINDVLRDMLDIYATAYLDDILIYSETLDDHIKHVRTVLENLVDNGLYCNLDKCLFHAKEVDFLGHKVTSNGIRTDPEKIKSIQNWKTPSCVKDIQSFLGFTNNYRKFIENYSDITLPITNLLKKDTEFN